tara:strand:+ start:67588 stop:67917 length:330 start_codon:yes stop_codon:yes gene_type:complete
MDNYEKEIEILTEVFDDYFIYINWGEKTAEFNSINFDFDYIVNLFLKNIIKPSLGTSFIPDFENPNWCYLLDTENLIGNLKTIDPNKLHYVTEPLIYLYREKKLKILLK